MYTALGIALATVLWTAAVAFAVLAVRTARTPQGSVAWVVFLLAAPHFAVPAYLFLGQSRITGVVSARRRSEGVVAELDAQREAQGAAVRAAPLRGAARLPAFERMGGMPVVAGNAYRLLVDGEATFAAIFDAIEQARSYVLVSFYIIRDDQVGGELRDLLVRKAGEGVPVRLLYDAIGCAGLAASYIESLRKGGVDVRDFHSLRRPWSRFQVNFRNHRKIVVVDGKTGFVGGHNAGDEYLGRNPVFGRWRDTHLMLRGPAVAQLQLVFSEDWYWASGETLALHWRPAPVLDGVDAMILAPGPADPVETGSLYFCNAIGAATRRLWIASPYFVPDIDTLTALKLAAYRGVDVRILLPDRRDHLVVWLAAFAYFDEVRAAGVRIWRYTGGFLHQKVVVVDDTLVSVGTINLDIRSCRLNFEATALIFDPEAVRQAVEMLEEDFAASRLHVATLSEQPLRIRLGAPFARLFAPLL
jgi:cardiolipin synthase A/B